MDRRKFLRRGLESAVLLYCAVELPAVGAATSQNTPDPSADPLASFPAFIDTLIPTDTTPSASQLGLDQALIQHARDIENYPRLLELGCEWLDSTAKALHRVRFGKLKPAQREAVVTLMEASPKGSVSWMFFERVQFDLFGLYYASPASWVGLGITAAPQPAGYADFTRPPRTRTRG